MSTVVLPRRSCRRSSVAAAVSGSALVALGAGAFQAEWASFDRPPNAAVVVDLLAVR